MPKISALTSLAQASVDTAADVLPIVDATAPATTKKVTVQAMVNAGLATLTTLPSGIVNASLNSITPAGGQLYVAGSITSGGNIIQVGAAGTGTGGNYRITDDGGTLRWLAGLLGTAGARDWTLLEVVSGRTPIRANASTGAVSIDHGLSVTGAFTASGNASFQANAIAQAGLRITGAAPLDANDGRLFAYEAPVTKFYVGDGTGYSFAFSKRAGGVSTDLVTITDAGALSVTGTVTGAGVRADQVLNATGTTGNIWTPTTWDMYVNGVIRGNLSAAGLSVTGSISATNSTGRIDANDSRAAGVGVGGSLFLRGKDDNGDYQDFAGINAFLTNGTVGAVGADLIFKTRLSGTFAERMRLLSSGDLLINQTTNPSSYKLAVTGNVGVTGAINATGTITSSNAIETLNSGSLFQYNAGSTTYFGTRNNANNLDVSYNGGGVITRTNSSGFSVTGSISATAAISSYTNINVTRDGSDTIGAGPYTQLRNTALTRSWATQLSASNNLDWWHLDGGWTKYMTLAPTGLSVTGLTTTDTLRVNVTPTAETPTATHTAVFNINGTNYKFLCLAA